MKKGTTADLLCELHVPVMEPIMSCTIKISIYDWNMAKRNDRIGCLTFDYNRVKADNEENKMPIDPLEQFAYQPKVGQKGKEKDKDKVVAVKKTNPNTCTEFGKPKWYILYGAPVGYQHGVARRMNQAFIEGSAYRGEVLLSLKEYR